MPCCCASWGLTLRTSAACMHCSGMHALVRTHLANLNSFSCDVIQDLQRSLGHRKRTRGPVRMPADSSSLVNANHSPLCGFQAPC